MGSAMAGILPMAVGAALSPLPIAAMILLLRTPRARVNGPVFAAGWLVGLAALGAVVLAVAAGRDYGEGSGPSTVARVVKGLLGALFLVRAARVWRQRPTKGHPAPPPGWMATIDRITGRRSAGLGVLLAAVNPKNLSLTVAAGTLIAQTEISGPAQTCALAGYVALGSVGILAPLVVYLARVDRAKVMLDDWNQWMMANNPPVMIVLFLLLGAVLVGKAISGVG
jgi:hypothetical protein